MSTFDNQKVIQIPKCTFVNMCCFTCGSLDFRSIDIETVERPWYMYNVCSDNDCIQTARDGIRLFLRSRLCLLAARIEQPVSIPRSDGSIDTDWKVRGMFLSTDGPKSILAQRSTIEKTVPYETFAQLNPTMTQVVEDEAKRLLNHYDNVL